MRLGKVILIAMLPLLFACKLLPPVDGGPSIAQSAEENSSAAPISLDEGQAGAAGLRPKPRPASLQTQAEATTPPDAKAETPLATAPTEPPAQTSSEQNACEKRGGIWGNAGKSSGKACVKRTRDAGKQCRKQGDCSSLCLARSGTCAPVKPLFGCNDILQKDGSRVTLCVD